MAKLLQGILGGIKGKIGNMVGSSWKGIPVIKTKALSVANPKTAGQVSQRSNMTAIVILSQLILSGYIKPLWDRFAVKMSGFNDFVSTNISCFVSGVFTNFANFVLSKGKMASTTIATAVAINNSAGCTFTWVDDSGEGYKLVTDIAYAIGYNETKDEWGLELDWQSRDTESITVGFPSAFNTGDKLHLYLSFKRTDGTIVSNTAYFAKTVTAS